jgi:arabinose-5-phosphate isomerase
MDAVMAMTKAQSGAALIADNDGRLLGIFTDGDFRRMMGKCLTPEHSNIPTFKHSNIQTFAHSHIQTFMTASPLFVRDDAYAAELLKIFERRQIDDLPVCNREGKVVGLVDIQDLPKMKVL